MHPAGERDHAPTFPLDASLTATHADFVAERPPGADEDVHMLASTVQHTIERCTTPGDLVFDPFAGFGTTLEHAIAMGRRAFGLELLPERVEFCRERVPEARVVEGDARGLLRLAHEQVPEVQGHVNLILTSPPYMTATGHDADPLTAYEQDGGDYARYLRELELVAAQCARMVAPRGYVVWNVADIWGGDVRTNLIDDCCDVLGKHLTEVGSTDIVWDRFPHDLVRDALLVFRR